MWKSIEYHGAGNMRSMMALAGRLMPLCTRMSIREKFNTYRFADHKEKVIDLLRRVCTVSVRTQEVVNAMIKTQR